MVGVVTHGRRLRDALTAAFVEHDRAMARVERVKGARRRKAIAASMATWSVICAASDALSAYQRRYCKVRGIQPSH